jgi:hypothetical protein
VSLTLWLPLPPGEMDPEYTFHRFLDVTTICSGHSDKDNIPVFQLEIKYQQSVL